MPEKYENSFTAALLKMLIIAAAITIPALAYKDYSDRVPADPQVEILAQLFENDPDLKHAYTFRTIHNVQG